MARKHTNMGTVDGGVMLGSIRVSGNTARCMVLSLLRTYCDLKEALDVAEETGTRLSDARVELVTHDCWHLKEIILALLSGIQEGKGARARYLALLGDPFESKISPEGRSDQVEALFATLSDGQIKSEEGIRAALLLLLEEE